MYDINTFELKKAESLSIHHAQSIPEIIYARVRKAEDKKADVPPDMLKNPLVNYENYGPYRFIAVQESRTVTVDVRDITPDNWAMHYAGLLNVFKDGIFSDRVQDYFINVHFGEEFGEFNDVTLSIIDYYFSLIMWQALIKLHMRIQPCHIFYDREMTAGTIKAYIDEHIIEDTRTTITTTQVNNLISDMLQAYHDIDKFANYLSNTLNLSDTADLMTKDPIYRDALTASYKGYQVDQVKDAIMKNTYLSIDRIKTAKQYLGHDHCLVDAWRAKEGINPKQYAEFTTAIGIKPNGHGGIFEDIVDTSFIGGGIKDPLYYFIESSTSRIAQIEKHKNVSKSGVLARIMGLNNMDTFLYPDPVYDCHSRNLVPIEVKSADHLKFLNLRWYRLSQNGQEKCIDYRRDKDLIGKTILLRSPCTCASNARGHAVCYKCYGKLAYTNYDAQLGFGINIGRIASELVTSKQTQKQLSAKHILEAAVNKINWVQEFYSFFEMENTLIRLNTDLENPQDYRILINQDSIESDSDYAGSADDEEDYDFAGYDEYITEFIITKKNGADPITITTEGGERLYITNELNGIIRRKAVPTEDWINIPMGSLKDLPLFYLKIQNNEISKILIKLKNLFNRSNEVKGKTIPALLQEIFDTNIEGSMGIASVHYEVILSNQIRDPEDVLERPDWDMWNPPYRILTLDESLTKNPSVTISLSYQKITRSFYDPLTYRKHGASFMDLFFMQNPQMVISGREIDRLTVHKDPKELYEPFTVVDDATKITAEDTTYTDDGSLLDVEK